jgi:chaperone required for assembly of F1-ATPase
VKRFYEVASVAGRPQGHAILLDGREVKTPAKRPLLVPTEALAQAIAEEWAAQGEKVVPASMRLTTIACTVIDRLPERRNAAVGQIAAFAETDFVCYWASEPEELVRRQQAAWQPLLDWATERFDAPLRHTSGVMPLAQPTEAVTALRRAVEALDPWRLAALHGATTVSGSLVIGLALVHGRLDADAAWRAARVDHDFQEERWGRDDLAAAATANAHADLAAAARLLELLDSSP